LILWALAALLLLAWLETTRCAEHDRLHGLKLAAARQMAFASQILREERLKRGVPVEAEFDLNGTGLIGPEFTPITSTLGDLPAKRTSTNPNMAGAVVQLLDGAGVGPGDCAAVAFSGSFPGLNIAVLAALKALDLRPVIVSSVGASSFGASDPRFTWPDMENALYERGVFGWPPAAVAPGGVVSASPIFGEQGLVLTRAAMDRSGLPVLDERGEPTLARDVDRRMRLYREACGGNPAVFINVGGSLVSLGPGETAERLPTGLLPAGPRRADRNPGLISQMRAVGTPVIHLLDVRSMARGHGLPVDPVPLPPVPSGRVMSKGGYSRTNAAWGIVLLGIIGWTAHRRSQ
jgi:poly-gamma-glutamate system protein